MSESGKRNEIDAKIKAWEQELERMRLALATASEAAVAVHEAGFVELYRMKEVVKSRWEAIRGTYRPDLEAVRRFEDARAAMEIAWDAAQSMRAKALAEGDA